MAGSLEAQKMLWVQQMMQQGLLDAQFDQLLQLQADDGPEFLQEIVGLYFEDAAGKMAKLDQCWAKEPVDFREADRTVHQLKGASASFGACQVAALCAQMRDSCTSGDAASGAQLTMQAKQAIATLQQRFVTFMQLLQ